MALIDPANQLVGTPMGSLAGIAPPNPLMQRAMAAPQPVATPGATSPAPPMPSRENLLKAVTSNKAMGDLLAQLLGSTDITIKAVIDALATAVGQGHATAQSAAAEIARLPKEPQAIRAMMQQRFLQNMDAGRRMNEMLTQYPVPTPKV